MLVLAGSRRLRGDAGRVVDGPFSVGGRVAVRTGRVRPPGRRKVAVTRCRPARRRRYVLQSGVSKTLQESAPFHGADAYRGVKSSSASNPRSGSRTERTVSPARAVCASR